MDKFGIAVPGTEVRLCGPQEVATMFDVQINTIYRWKWKQNLPEPALIVSGTDLWDAQALIAWGVETGRLSHDGQPTKLLTPRRPTKAAIA